MANSRPLLSVSLRVDYPNKPRTLKAVSFDIYPGEVLGLVGESGSGKSTVALALLRLLSEKGGRVQGHILFRDRDLLAASEREMRGIRGREMGLILQSPASSLNPALRIGCQLEEAWKSHATGTRSQMETAVERALSSVGLPVHSEFRSRYPSQISVGQAQRVLIGMAVMHSPALLIADEPTSALDAMTQWEIMRLFSALNCKTGSAVLYISHDLLSVASICHRIAILHEGEIVECRATQAVLTRPIHPYTQRLLACIPWLAGLGRPSPIMSHPLSEPSGAGSDSIGSPAKLPYDRSCLQPSLVTEGERSGGSIMPVGSREGERGQA
jgi:ABC-type dipeptide/oligopeptide/nickel transport system ATPase component